MSLTSINHSSAAAENLSELKDAGLELSDLANGLEDVMREVSELRAAFGRFPSGIAALCSEAEGERRAMVVTSFSVGVSFEPPIVMFSVQNTSTTWPKLRAANRIGVSVLAEAHAGIVRQLASRSGDRLAGLDIVATERGALLISGAAIWMECEILTEHPAGDHHVVLLEVKTIRVEADVPPLVYHGAQFWRLANAG